MCFCFFMDTVRAIFVSGKFSSNSAVAQMLFEKSRFGEKDGDKIFYMMEEVYFLVEQGKMDVFSVGYKKLTNEDVLKKIVRLDKGFLTRYVVFRDLRKKGYIVKSALKFGADFRIYEKGKSIGGGHSKWICFCVSENKGFSWGEFASKNRVAHSTKKNLLIGIVDQENDVSYYDISWKKVV